jgi:hypothetical protein
MGLLDDAIREHLDLQRRRGADPADVERAEREALGPVRRAPGATGGDAEPSPGLDAEQGFAYDQAGELGWDAEPAGAVPGLEEGSADHALEPAEPPVFEHAIESDELHEEPALEHPERALEDRDPAPERVDPAHVEPDVARHEPHGASEQPPASPARPAAEPATGDETVEYDVERALGSKEADEDVLQETPEFLQDTPDHDRLWFEQRPPRDFDFDK